MTTASQEGFIPGMRASGECPRHPGQPYYHCPECSKERKQLVGDEIADSLLSPTSGENALVPEPVPVRVTPRAKDRLIAAIRSFRWNRLEGRIQLLRERMRLIPKETPETAATKKILDEWESEAADAGLDVDNFDVVVQVYIDITKVSGVQPDIKMAEPSKEEKFDKNYRLYNLGLLTLAVERQHMNYLRGLVVDWHDRLDKSGFVLSHPSGEWSFKDR